MQLSGSEGQAGAITLSLVPALPPLSGAGRALFSELRPFPLSYPGTVTLGPPHLEQDRVPRLATVRTSHFARGQTG